MLQQQMQAQHLPHAHAPPIPMPPHPGLPGMPGLPPSSAGLMLGSIGGAAAAHLPGIKDEKGTLNGNVLVCFFLYVYYFHVELGSLIIVKNKIVFITIFFVSDYSQS